MIPTKICYKCKKELPITPEYFHHNKNRKDGFKSICKECRKIYETTSRKDYRLRKDFGITLKLYNELLESQNNKCAICDRNILEFNKRFAVDHNHRTDKIRGLLCASCNMKIGVIEEYLKNPKKWNNYLKEVR